MAGGSCSCPVLLAVAAWAATAATAASLTRAGPAPARPQSAAHPAENVSAPGLFHPRCLQGEGPVRMQECGVAACATEIGACLIDPNCAALGTAAFYDSTVTEVKFAADPALRSAPWVAAFRCAYAECCEPGLTEEIDAKLAAGGGPLRSMDCDRPTSKNESTVGAPSCPFRRRRARAPRP